MTHDYTFDAVGGVLLRGSAWAQDELVRTATQQEQRCFLQGEVHGKRRARPLRPQPPLSTATVAADSAISPRPPRASSDARHPSSSCRGFPPPTPHDLTQQLT